MGRRTRGKRLAEGSRSYRKCFIISAEGKETEKIYFNMFKSRNATVDVQVVKKTNNKSAPQYILKEATRHVKKFGMRRGDEVWVVIDRDSWPDAELDWIFEECCRLKYNLAVSNPKFEYWLLLHFEDAKGVNSPKKVTERLKKYLPNYDKNNLNVLKVKEGVHDAIKRAKLKDSPPTAKWLSRTGSTVYKLVEKLID